MATLQTSVKSAAPSAGAVKLNDPGPVTTGNTGVLDFDIERPPVAGDFSGLFQAIGTVTGLVADLQYAADRVNFVNYQTNILVAATPIKMQTPLVAGGRWRINITTAPTSADFYVVVN